VWKKVQFVTTTGIDTLDLYFGQLLFCLCIYLWRIVCAVYRFRLIYQIWWIKLANFGKVINSEAWHAFDFILFDLDDQFVNNSNANPIHQRSDQYGRLFGR
jgi:hypothetical protein